MKVPLNSFENKSISVITLFSGNSLSNLWSGFIPGETTISSTCSKCESLKTSSSPISFYKSRLSSWIKYSLDVVSKYFLTDWPVLP